jgi:hypothetical protein
MKFRRIAAAAVLSAALLGAGSAIGAGTSPVSVTLTAAGTNKVSCSATVNGSTGYACTVKTGPGVTIKAKPPVVNPPVVVPPVTTGTETVIPHAFTTGYGWWDNTPRGSSTISNPVIHKVAGGTGTYADPATIAVGHVLSGGKDILDYPQGTRIYIPNVRKYFIVEDTCGDGSAPQNIGCHKLYGTANHNDADPGNTTWVDLWIGGSSATQSASDNCESNLTDTNGGSHTIIVNPKPTYLVVSGDVLLNGVCRANYGNTPLAQ